jgi:hypothetical protein
MKSKISFIVRKQYNEVTQNQQNLHLNYNQMNEVHLPYILESNTHPFYSFRGPKSRVRIGFVVESWILEK